MKIIGISGKKQSGKTTAVEDLYNRARRQFNWDGWDIEVINFASSLKAVVNGFWIEPVLGRQLRWDEWDNEKTKNTKHPCGLTYRELLQEIGTTQWRKLWPDIWIENWKSLLPTKNDRISVVLVPDVRFPNEVKCIQDLGGVVIRLLRNPYNDKHESETALNWLDGEYWNPPQSEAAKKIYTMHFDAFVDNRNMDIAEQNDAVWKLVTEKKWI